MIINEKEAKSHILKYCLVKDVSDRGWKLKKIGQWVKGKSPDTYELIKLSVDNLGEQNSKVIVE